MLFATHTTRHQCWVNDRAVSPNYCNIDAIVLWVVLFYKTMAEAIALQILYGVDLNQSKMYYKKKGLLSPYKMNAPQTCPAGLFLSILLVIVLTSTFSCWVKLCFWVDRLSMSCGGRGSLPAIKSSI